ncbi:MAG: hypothetical protein CSA20_03225 [Deltaproteobacteria bacterium]|nr:MAG: hypothetical protein CSA20_03225 [Deltaproteobacteria bacterium]
MVYLAKIHAKEKTTSTRHSLAYTSHAPEMRKTLYKTTVTFLLLHLSAGVVFAKDLFQANVTRIIDGDSLVVQAKDRRYEIRLYGIDTPEYDQPYAGKARRYLKSSFLHKRVTVTPIEYDKYGRLVAIVGEPGMKPVNALLLEKGLAWFYPRYCKKSICKSWKKIEKRAKRRHINIWSGQHPVPPWLWKRLKKKRRHS